MQYSGLKYLQERATVCRIRCEVKDKQIIEQRKKLLKNIEHLAAPTINEFYNGASVFVTGGTGFVGKVLVEKLLRSCPGIDKMYFLVREKKGTSPEDRLSEMFQSELFEKLVRENPDALKKVVPIIGDAAQLGLGLSEDDRMLLQHKVTVVFHAAATVRFDEPFSRAVILNCRGTREVAELCKSMLKLKVMVLVSTTYCNTDNKVNEERVYPAHLHWKDVIRIAETDDPNLLQTLNYKLIGKLPNIYTFTKRIAENIINDYRHDVPVIIGRPSVENSPAGTHFYQYYPNVAVMATVADPVPGWWNSIIGAPGFQIGFETGILRVAYCDPNIENDYFAVDYVVRELILLSWIRGVGLRLGADPQKVDVVNMTVQDCYDISQKDMLIGEKEVLEIYPPIGIRTPNTTMTKNKFYFMYRVLTAHVLFAIVVDILLRLAGKKPRLLAIYRRVHFANLAVQFFICNNYLCKCDNYTKSVSYLKEADLWHFNQIIAFDFVKYVVDSRLGVDKYILRRENDFKWNRRLQLALKVINWIWQSIKIYILYQVVCWILPKVITV